MFAIPARHSLLPPRKRSFSLSPPLSLRRTAPFSKMQRLVGHDLCAEGFEVAPRATKKDDRGVVVTPPPPASNMNTVLFIECGVGCDSHGQDSTKASVRAARNAIELNSIPSIRRLVPGGYDALKLHVKIGVPHPETVDVDAVKGVFPYGQCVVDVVGGGLSAGSGIAIEALGDTSDEMVIAVCAVTVGYFDEEKEEKEGEEAAGGGRGRVPSHGGFCE